VRKNLAIVIVAAVTAACLTLATAQDKGAPPAPAKGKGGRGGKKGPAGPLPRLSDGKPDLSGVWNGFGGSGNDAPNMLPWAAKIVADHRAAGGAEDFEARCLPGGPPRGMRSGGGRPPHGPQGAMPTRLARRNGPGRKRSK